MLRFPAGSQLVLFVIMGEQHCGVHAMQLAHSVPDFLVRVNVFVVAMLTWNSWMVVVCWLVP